MKIYLSRLYLSKSKSERIFCKKDKDGKVTFNRVKVDLVKNLAKFGVIKKEHM